ncbi:MAG TPA: 3-isopropylmalate dehydrogenase [Wenzhouxiangella sp.]|nr:3-isopropylmalate dehydrogenase [Wenzhouxiangella sp.]
MKAHIVTLPGDGIGPEITAAAVEVLQAVAARFGHTFKFSFRPVGGQAIDRCGRALPAETLAACEQADAVLLGAVGGPKWDSPQAAERPEQGLLQLRAALGVHTNLRPIRVHPALAGLSPLKSDRLENVDILFVRELTGGLYFGQRRRGDDFASDECRYTTEEIERVARRAFSLARARRGLLTSVDKANVLETSRLWRATVNRLAADYPDVQVQHQLVDSMAMLLLTHPSQYDVVLTENLFGDILSDEAAALTGSLGLLPSASLGSGRTALYEPVHGSAPELAGTGRANPLGAILSAALLLRHSLALEKEAAAVESVVAKTISDGTRSRDLNGRAGTAEITAAIVQLLEQG